MQDGATIQAGDDATSIGSSSSHTKGLDSSFDSCTIQLLADYLKILAMMGIDKCTSRCLIQSSYALTCLRNTLMKLSLC